MSRLRVRIELNRRMTGVPLDKMASVVEETRKFFHLLSEDVHIEADRGEWVASDFDTESLNFTAEYQGHVSPEQSRAFGAAFGGATSLRRITIAQFTRIADFLGEDELVGFGLFQSDQDSEPSEWRCLSKRDALRFGEEIKLLAEAAGEAQFETSLPAVMNGSIAGRRLFKERRDREALATDPSKLIRDMESNLSRRIALLEEEVAAHAGRMQKIGGNPDVAEERFLKMLATMEKFWAQAPPQFPQLAAPTAAEVPRVPLPTPLPVPMGAAAPHRWSVLGVGIAATVAIVAGLAFPEIQHQWLRMASVEILPTARPKAPSAPVLPIPAPPKPPKSEVRAKPHPEPARETSHSEPRETPRPPKAAVKMVAARSPEPFVGPQIPLDIPAGVKARVQSQVQVDVLVAIDESGNVTDAHVTSTKGDSAPLLVSEALRAARQSRFRPAREGQKNIQSQMILTFLFTPESDEF
jgi:Gram-negative bacterial TonB protein C-terminal